MSHPDAYRYLPGGRAWVFNPQGLDPASDFFRQFGQMPRLRVLNENDKFLAAESGRKIR